MLFGKKKINEKKKAQTPADVFFNGMNDLLEYHLKEIAKMDTCTDIDKNIKMFSKDKKLTQMEVFQLCLYNEELLILEMMYRPMVFLSTDKVIVPDKIYNILLDNSGLLHDRAMKFTKEILNLLPFDENKKIGFREVDIIGYRKMYEVVAKRIDYIRKLAVQKGFTEKDLELTETLFLFDKTFKDAVIKKPEYDKGEMIIGILKAFPEGTFNRKGLAPLY